MRKILAYISIAIFSFSCQEPQKEKKSNVSVPAPHKTDIVYTKASEEINILIQDLIDGGRLKKYGANKLRFYETIDPDIHDFYFLQGHNEMVKRWMDFDLFTKYRKDLAAQIDSSRNFRLDSTQFADIQLVLRDSVDLDNPKPDREYKFKPFYRIYTPIFSSDGQLAILPIDFICIGLCSENWHLVFKRTGNKWIEVGLIPGTIS